jgi:hypothetical protein
LKLARQALIHGLLYRNALRFRDARKRTPIQIYFVWNDYEPKINCDFFLAQLLSNRLGEN